MPRHIDAIKRHALFGLKLLVEANDQYLAGGDEMIAAVNAIQKDWTNIKVAQKNLEQLISTSDSGKIETDEELSLMFDICNAYPDAGAYIISLQCAPKERLHWLETALIASKTLGNNTTTQAHLGNIGLSLLELGETQKAIQYFKEASELAKKIGDYNHTGIWLGNLGNAYAVLGDHEKAIGFHRRQLEIARKSGDLRGQGHASANLGVSYAELSLYEDAKKFYKQHLSIAQQLEDKRDECHALFSLGTICFDQTDIEGSKKLYSEALLIAEAINDEALQALCLGGKADIFNDCGQYEQAIALLEEALEIVAKVDDVRILIRLLDSLGDAYILSKNYEKALNLFQKTEALAKTSKNRPALCQSLSNQVSIYHRLGNNKQAMEIATIVLPMAEDLVQQESIAFIHWQLGLIFEEEDDIKNAFFHFKKSVQLEEKYNFPNLIEHHAYFEKFRYDHALCLNGCVD